MSNSYLINNSVYIPQRTTIFYDSQTERTIKMLCNMSV
jgi:hypothetical protein